MAKTMARTRYRDVIIIIILREIDRCIFIS